MKHFSLRTLLLTTTVIFALSLLGTASFGSDQPGERTGVDYNQIRQGILDGTLSVAATSLEEPCILPGDVNNCGAYDAMDIVYLVDWFWNGGPAPPSLAQADVNCDCTVDAMDLLYILENLWQFGPDPCDPCDLPCWGGGDCCELRGDFNHDGIVDEWDLSDWNAWRVGIGPGPYCMEEINVDGIGEVDIMDYIYFTDFILGNGPAPVPCP